jgi:hypothetical protein
MFSQIVANQNHPSLKFFLMKEFSQIPGELTDDGRRADLTFVEIEQIDAPIGGSLDCTVAVSGP